MKQPLYTGFLAIILASFTACQSSTPKENTEGADTSNRKPKRGNITKRTQDGCYVHVSGKDLRDTLYVKLHVEKDQVTGKMIDAIWEKDSRKGDIKGTLLPNKTIKAVWTFMQEGMTDTMSVALKMDHTGLLIKPFKFDEKTGRQMTDESAAYNIALKPADCNK
ncbi:hypothetical protein LLH06_06215 [Mucilaginibacter daejeonensis]|uniref:hypothetical protein n=1 Tax=Mucilaginibacter daejeonensis TaxID=398049 RepID=UPI001D177BBE|nr:hypothetical protein [Mucilaginibacter daejeonensis]UEG54554.1 hypothetical protein LLH06_06215 [Mucilaginibacter daejeonensis]